MSSGVWQHKDVLNYTSIGGIDSNETHSGEHNLATGLAGDKRHSG